MRVAFLAVGVVGSGIALGLYIGAGLGPGPRDGLMTGHGRPGPLGAGRAHRHRGDRPRGRHRAGRVLGVGTVVYAFAIGPIAHVTLPRFDRGPTPVDADSHEHVVDLEGL